MIREEERRKFVKKKNEIKAINLKINAKLKLNKNG